LNGQVTVLGIPNARFWLTSRAMLWLEGKEALKRERLTEVEAGKWLERGKTGSNQSQT
jgi:hypothetical protein